MLLYIFLFAEPCHQCGKSFVESDYNVIVYLSYTVDVTIVNIHNIYDNFYF